MSTTETNVQAVLIEKAHDGYLVFFDGADGDYEFVDRIRINGYHASASEEFEIEADGVDIVQTGTRERTAVLDVGAAEI